MNDAEESNNTYRISSIDPVVPREPLAAVPDTHVRRYSDTYQNVRSKIN